MNEDFLFQLNHIKIFGHWFRIGKYPHRWLRKLFPDKCRLCGGLLHQRLLGGVRVDCHGAITINEQTVYVCHLCYDWAKRNNKTSVKTL